MSEIVRARVEERLVKLYFKTVAQRLDAILSQAARTEPTYLDFLDQILGEECVFRSDPGGDSGDIRAPIPK